jgi:3-hydroxyisobutyrate dehydrogenase
LSDATRDEVGFIGTGTIGEPMAQRLLAAGHRLVVCDARREAARALEEGGARFVAAPLELARDCALVFTSLPGPDEVDAVVEGEDGLLQGARSGDVHVDLTTNAFDRVRRLQALESEAGVSFVDSPVSGGAIGASQGTLTVMASGDALAFERARPFMEAFANRFFFLGKTGSGTLAKLVNNAIFLCGGLLLQEGFVLAAKAGLDCAKLLEVVKASSGAMYSGMADLTFARRFDQVIFKLAIAAKDVSLAVESGDALGVPMPVTQAAADLYRHACREGRGDSVFYATLETLEAMAGAAVPKLGD